MQKKKSFYQREIMQSFLNDINNLKSHMGPKQIFWLIFVQYHKGTANNVINKICNEKKISIFADFFLPSSFIKLENIITF